MNKIWFFGDSFCAYNENWVNDLAQKCNCEVAHLGTVGSSLIFLLNDLEKYKNQIKPDDRVVVLFTGVFRDYYNGNHFLTTQHASGLSCFYGHVKHNNQEIKNITETFDKFRLLFFNQKEYEIRASAVICHIINSVIPSLKTNKVIYHYSLNNAGVRPFLSSYTKQREYEPVDFMNFGEKFCIKYIPDRNSRNIILTLDKEYGTNNHWVKHPLYKEKWWETYEPIFKDLF